MDRDEWQNFCALRSERTMGQLFDDIDHGRDGFLFKVDKHQSQVLFNKGAGSGGLLSKILRAGAADDADGEGENGDNSGNEEV